MSAENKALVRRFTDEILNRGNGAAADELFSPDFKFYFAGRVESRDRAAFFETFMPFRAGFPDVVFTIEDLIAEGDRVAARFRMSGTHLGTFRGIAATGRRVQWGGIAIFRIAGGRIVEEWPVPDVLGLLEQLREPGIP